MVKQITKYQNEKILYAEQLNQDNNSQSTDALIGYFESSGLPKPEFDLGDLTAIANGALVGDLLAREGKKIKVYNASSALIVDLLWEDLITNLQPATNTSYGVTKLKSYALLTYDVPSGTNGGSSTSGLWTTRPLNTEVYDNDNIVTLASSQFTLQAGTYKISAVAVQILAGAVQVVRAKERIRNITDGTTLAVSSNSYKDNIGGFIPVTNIVPETIFTITSVKVFSLQHYVTTALASVGLGATVSSGEVERYSEVLIEKFN